MIKRTPFYDLHLRAQAKMVDFSGWEMPLHYGSQIQEHHHVRQHAGMFDVSHMAVVDLKGADVLTYLSELLANDVGRMQTGQALYTCMLNEKGGVIDDLIVYKIAGDFYRLVVNAGTREKDIAWMKKHIGSQDVHLTDRSDLVMLAVQGPESSSKLLNLLNNFQHEKLRDLKPFRFIMLDEYFFARTGYTGEDGYEIIFPSQYAETVWQKLLDAGVKPCGLGARDTLRLEAGLNLYGSDMDESVTPYESNLGWTVAMEPQSRRFIGREALEKEIKEGSKYRLVGLVLQGKGVIRNHQKVFVQEGAGEVTSGGYSPTLEGSIALARIPAGNETVCMVEIRDKKIPAQVVKPPFVRKGKKMIVTME